MVLKVTVKRVGLARNLQNYEERTHIKEER